MADDRQTAFDAVSRADWQARVAQGEPDSLRRTVGGVEIGPLYSAVDGRGLAERGGSPGHAPYMRGGPAVRDRTSGWRIAHHYETADPQRLADQLKSDMAHGRVIPWVVVDGGPQRGDVLGSGVATGLHVSDAASLARALDGVDLGQTPVWIDAGATPRAHAAMLAVVAEAGHVELDALAGGVVCDPLGTLVVEGELALPIERALEGLVEVVRWADAAAPRLAVIGISGIPYHDAGASAVDELALALATGIEYLRAVSDAGVDVGCVTRHTVMRLAVGDDQFVEIAKLRAARLLWAAIVRTAGGDEAAQGISVHVQTSRQGMVPADPWELVIRGTTRTFAAVAGGADMIATASFDDEQLARRMAINTQLLLHHESHMQRVIDPAGGSYYVENLTAALAEAVWSRVRGIEAAGGIRRLIEGGQLPDGLRTVVGGSSAGHQMGRAERRTGMSAAMDAARAGAQVREIALAYGGGERTTIPARLDVSRRVPG